MSQSVAQSTCLGLGSTESNAICRKIKKKKDCIRMAAFDNVNVTASCIWHENLASIVRDTQTMRSKQGAPLGVTGLNYRGSLCGIKASVQVPSSAKSLWGANIRLRGGPSASTTWYSNSSPDIQMASSGCTVSKGAPLKCTAQIVAPKGYALDPNFIENNLAIDFFTSHGSRVKAWQDKQSLDKGQELDVRATYEFMKCGVNKKDEPFNRNVPIISDTVWLGVTSYQLYDNFDRGYFDLSYRTYQISKAKAVTWEFDILKTIRKQDPEQKLVTFLMKEEDYQKWAEKCIQCYAPTELAINGTFCEGTSCKVEKKYLGWKNGEYRIFIGYSEVCNAYNDKCYNEDTPANLKSGNIKELVNINIYPQLKLSKPVASRFIFPGGNAKTALPMSNDMPYTVIDFGNRAVIPLS